MALRLVPSCALYILVYLVWRGWLLQTQILVNLLPQPHFLQIFVEAVAPSQAASARVGSSGQSSLLLSCFDLLKSEDLKEIFWLFIFPHVLCLLGNPPFSLSSMFPIYLWGSFLRNLHGTPANASTKVGGLPPLPKKVYRVRWSSLCPIDECGAVRDVDAHFRHYRPEAPWKLSKNHWERYMIYIYR